MTTIDVFQRAVTAMSTFGDIPLGGEVYRFDAAYDVRFQLDEKAQPAQALLAWLGSLSGVGYLGDRLSHHHANGKVFVTVEGKRDGLNWDIWSTFEGDDAAVLCEHDDDHGPLSVHRLRAVQMRQLAVAAGVRSLTEALGGVR